MEHLVPSSAGGSGHPDNLVACCKALNTLFGSMSIKEKIRAILRQNGKFVCPNQSMETQPVHRAPPLLQAARPAMSPPVSPVSTMPANHGKSWTPEEDERLVRSFKAQTSIPDIAKAHERGIGGIQSRLAKLLPEYCRPFPPTQG